jgi:hypothetical protein
LAAVGRSRAGGTAPGPLCVSFGADGFAAVANEHGGAPVADGVRLELSRLKPGPKPDPVIATGRQAAAGRRVEDVAKLCQHL